MIQIAHARNIDTPSPRRKLKRPSIGAARNPATYLLLPSTLLVLIVLYVPIAMVFRFSLNHYEPGQLMTQALTLENYSKFFSDRFYQSVLWTTLWMAATSSVVALLLGFPLAYLISRASSVRIKSLLIIVIVLPLLMGNAVRMAGWIVLLGDRGVVNASIQALGLAETAVRIMYTPWAVLIGLISVLLPYMVITLQSVLDAITPAYEEAALNLGASPARMLRRVLLPLALPGIIAGTLLCFILAMNAYATPVLIGGPSFHMMAPKVYEQVIKVSNWPFGGALAFVLMSLTLAFTILAGFVLGRRYAKWAEVHDEHR